MRKLLFIIVMCMTCLLASAQTYTITSGGQGNSGNYLVKITVSTKKNPTKEAENLVKRYAVHGVIFRGLMAADGYGEQKPLVKDPNVESTKAEFFNAFWKEGAYTRYATIVPSSLSVIKNKQTKMVDTSASVLVDKESLEHYLEESGVIKGFSNLW